MKHFIDNSIGRVHVTNTKDVPSTPGVYLFTDEDARVLYVGESENLYKRLSCHKFKKNHRSTWITYMPCEDHKEMELKVIQKTKPLFNKKDNPHYVLSGSKTG